MMQRRLFQQSCQMLLLSACLVALAAPCGFSKTTTSSGDGNWNAVSWSSGLPVDGDTVTINHAVVITNSPPSLAQITVNASKSLTFVGWSNAVLTASVVNVNGTITHSNNWLVTTTNALGQWVPSNRVWIVCSSLTVATNGAISADQMGFNYGNPIGYGPGAGGHSTGASYGGRGGYGDRGPLTTGLGTPTNTYGSATAPEDLGSGGGTWGGYGVGRPGGGAVRIDATGDVTVNGSISANGGDASGPGGSGGSGGSVWITCNTIQGNGTVSAKGGAPKILWAGEGSGGGGGGGRIAVNYTPSAQSNVTCSVAFSVWAGPVAAYYDNYAVLGLRPDSRAELGTLSFPDPQVFPRATMLGDSGRPIFPGFVSWSPSSLTISNSYIFFPSNFTLSVGGNVSIMGANGRLEFDAGSTCTVAGALSLTNGGALSAYCGPTTTNTAASVLVDVAGDMNVSSGCWVYAYSHPTNGGSALFRMSNLNIASGGGFNADGRGCRGGKNPYDPNKVGSTYYGYGKGAGDQGWGGCYGGLGGKGYYGTTNLGTYGSSNAPVDPGSGGGTYGGYGSGGNGGGLIRIEALSGKVTVNGAITANGQSANASYGAGSGGGIFIRCRTFAGTGIVCANGAAGIASGNGGGAGGGGRVAIWRENDISSLSAISARAGTNGYGAPYATDGTVVRILIPAPGTTVIIY